MKGKNILVFGSTGQVGKNLIRKLTKNNHRVTAVTRNLHKKGYILRTSGNAGYIDVVESNIFNEENCPYELMHCRSTYPMEDSHANLNAIMSLKKEFNCNKSLILK